GSQFTTKARRPPSRKRQGRLSFSVLCRLGRFRRLGFICFVRPDRRYRNNCPLANLDCAVLVLNIDARSTAVYAASRRGTILTIVDLKIIEIRLDLAIMHLGLKLEACL